MRKVVVALFYDIPLKCEFKKLPPQIRCGDSESFNDPSCHAAASPSFSLFRPFSLSLARIVFPSVVRFSNYFFLTWRRAPSYTVNPEIVRRARRYGSQTFRARRRDVSVILIFPLSHSRARNCASPTSLYGRLDVETRNRAGVSRESRSTLESNVREDERLPMNEILLRSSLE